MLAIRCSLLRATFEGARTDDPRSGEWPPSWMRVFCAMVSNADLSDERETATLARMESLEPPLISDCKHMQAFRSAFVPTNQPTKKTDKPGHTVLPGRTNGERGWARTAPRSPDVWYRWDDVVLEPDERRTLASICRRVPYLGRSTSPAILDVVDETPPDVEWLTAAPPEATAEEFEFVTVIRTPYPGSLQQLREAYDRKYVRGEAGDPWAIGRPVEYGRPRQRTGNDDREPYGGPYEHLIVFALEGRQLDGRHAARVTTAFRRALMSRAKEPIPAALHGHHDGSVVQCAFLALPFVDHEHADGHLLGLALALPSLPREDVRAIYEAAIGLEHIDADALGVLEVRRISPVDALRRARGLRPDAWIGPSRRWATALPMVFDRYLKKGDDPDQAALLAVRNALGLEPEAIITARQPCIGGALDLAPQDTVRRAGESGFRPYRHAVIRFPRPVRGPLVVGSMRHYGLGLCWPLRD